MQILAAVKVAGWAESACVYLGKVSSGAPGIPEKKGQGGNSVS